jgi:subtilisin-like proprotein convertase family protein
MHASYSTPGASLVVTAPGGDHENASNHITANVGGGCRDPGVGTSFACPVVSGVVALVLEANPELTWRDVQGILATTSRMVLNDPYDTSRVVNAAGLSHSNLYGFGVVDASAAVEAAKTWELYSTEKRIMGESGIFDWALVPDDSSSFVMSTIQLVPDTDDFLVESVEVYIDLQHFSRGDLEIVLTSPHGAESVLHPGNRPENTLLEEGDSWKLLTVRAWGESAKGDWTMVIRDISPGDALKCADAPWTVSFVADGLVLDCDYIASFELCVDGALNPTADTGQLYLLLSFEDHGRDIAEACCLCGGGLSTNAFEDQLRQWRIVVYGREIENPTSVPTKTPTNANISIASSIEAPVLALPSPAPSPSSSSLAPPTIPVTTIPRTQVRGGSSSSGSPGRIIQFHFGLLLAPSIILVLIY